MSLVAVGKVKAITIRVLPEIRQKIREIAKEEGYSSMDEYIKAQLGITTKYHKTNCAQEILT